MSRQHTEGPGKHRFTNDIIVLGTKPTNKHNTYSVCKACDDVLGRDEALKFSLTNKKNTIQNHLKRCTHFLAKLGSQEAVDAYCNRTDDEEENTSQVSKRHRNTDISDNDSMSDVTTSNNTSPPTKAISKKKTKKPSGSITNFTVRTITAKEKPTFERLLLPTTHELPLETSAYNSDDELGQTSTHSNELHLPLLQAFGGILKMWEENDDNNLSQHMILQLEQRWKQWEQPLLLLAFLLNPNIRDTWFNTNTENLNFTYLAQFISYYYKAWFGHRPTCILLEFEEYRKYRYPFDHATYEQFKGDVLKFWEFAFPSTKELGLLAANKSTHSQERIEPSELNDLAELGEDEQKNWLDDWEQMLEDEETARLEEEEAEREDDSCNLNNDLLSNYIHPAVDPKAKWDEIIVPVKNYHWNHWNTEKIWTSSGVLASS
ncbi:14974_t:CDS:2 [Cetraspora pellucida]|uniref:14974_t:CDS:1 n=1 Tax=Cetraspora pellucida TaxID=1433469 RepID=A0ACA9MK04_9GLOM|nr:14974_t:CDS:2 [Cetraspora pellucida]